MPLKIPKVEKGLLEFKERLSSAYHLKEEQRQHLAAQMRYRLEAGRGKAVYILGVSDKGLPIGLSELEFEEALQVLRVLAAENSAELSKVERFVENGKLIGRVVINKTARLGKPNLVVAVAGHVGHGKSTLIATLLTGRADENHDAWLLLNVLPHEIERGLSADLHHAVWGFKQGVPLRYSNPLDKKEKAKVVEEAEKLVSFVDTVGHEAWLRTTIRGILGQELDCGLLAVAADDGITPTAKEHLGLLLAANLPLAVCITKADKVSAAKLEAVVQGVGELLKFVGRVPYLVKGEADVCLVLDKLSVLVPIFITSAVSLQGYGLVEKFLALLQPKTKELNKPFLMYVDRVYQVPGVGVVVSGTIKQGMLRAGAELLIGPDSQGKFKLVKAKSIETYYCRLSEARAGYIVGIALRRIKAEEVQRGMVLCEPALQPKAVRRFEAEVLVLYHPTKISNGYEPVCHIATIAQSVEFELLDKPYLKSGESGKVRMKFKYRPCFIQAGDKLVFREGKTKGIGSVVKLL